MGENESSEIESSGPCGTSMSPEVSTNVDWLAVAPVEPKRVDMVRDYGRRGAFNMTRNIAV